MKPVSVMRPGSASALPPGAIPVSMPGGSPQTMEMVRQFDMAPPRMGSAGSGGPSVSQQAQAQLRGRRPWSAGARTGQAQPNPAGNTSPGGSQRVRPGDDDRAGYMYPNAHYYPQWTE